MKGARFGNDFISLLHVALEGSRTPVRSLRLEGLDAVASAQLLAEKEVVGLTHDWERLIELYVGNPLALKIVAETIVV